MVLKLKTLCSRKSKVLSEAQNESDRRCASASWSPKIESHRCKDTCDQTCETQGRNRPASGFGIQDWRHTYHRWACLRDEAGHRHKNKSAPVHESTCRQTKASIFFVAMTCVISIRWNQTQGACALTDACFPKAVTVNVRLRQHRHIATGARAFKKDALLVFQNAPVISNHECECDSTLR